MRPGVVLAALILIGCAADQGSEQTGEDDIRFTPAAVDTTLPEVDSVGYDVDLAVDDTLKKETFTATVKGTYVATKDLTELALDFGITENDPETRIDEARVNGAFASHSSENGQVVLRFPQIKAGQTFTTTLKYHGAPTQADGQNPDDFAAFGGFMVKQKNSDGRRIFTTLSWPSKARRWLPLRDHPRDTAMVAFTLTFPSKYTVLANGKRISTKDAAGGKKTWRYEALQPMPTYDFHISAYEDWKIDSMPSGNSGVPITTYAYAKDHAKVKSIYGDLPKAMDFYTQLVGPYHWGTSSFIQEPIFGGGMEHASVVSMDETLFTDAHEARTTAFHELAHHWSGNSVHFRTWNDFWLSEGFTEYLTARALTQIDGAEAGKAVWRDYLKSALDADKTTPHALAPGGSKEIDVLTIFDAIPYQKGALVVRMLESVAGQPKMDAFLKSWFERHGLGAAVTTDDLERELTEATKADFRGIFSTFVRESHHPELHATFTQAQAGGEVSIEVKQLQELGPRGGFKFPLALDLIDASGKSQRVTVDLTGKTTTKKVAASGVIKSLVVDPDEVAIAVVSCGQSGGGPCKEGFRCVPQHEAVSACVPN